jgi:hypothetical protein
MLLARVQHSYANDHCRAGNEETTISHAHLHIYHLARWRTPQNCNVPSIVLSANAFKGFCKMAFVGRVEIWNVMESSFFQLSLAGNMLAGRGEARLR